MAIPVIPNTYQCQWIWEYSSGLPTDVAVNTTYFLADTPISDADAVSAIGTAMEAFWFAANTTTPPMSDLIPVDWGTARYKVYDLSQAAPRLPIGDVVASSGGTGGGTQLPAEVAATLSFYSTGAGPRNLGRFYVGPLVASAVGPTANGVSIAATTRTRMTEAALKLIVGDGVIWGTGSDFRWAQVSPSNAAAGPVLGGWVDDSPDTIRSRGHEPTVRTTFGLPRQA